MKLIFTRGPSLQFRIVVAIITSITLVIFENQCNTFDKVRNYLDVVVSPFYFFANGLRDFLDTTSDALMRRDQLLFENKVLKKEVILKKADILLLEHLKEENARFRELLRSPLRKGERIMVTQVLSGINTLYQDKIVIDKGLHDGVYKGQPVISDKGVVGQVIAVNPFNSRVLLICDPMHALPTQVLRNDIRAIAMGTGCTGSLRLENLPSNIDIRIGDVLVTSGLGGRFPEGYPVAVVSSIKYDTQRAYTIIHARAIADLQRLRYLLLLWKSSSDSFFPLPPSEVYQVANKRLMKLLPKRFFSSYEP